MDARVIVSCRARGADGGRRAQALEKSAAKARIIAELLAIAAVAYSPPMSVRELKGARDGVARVLAAVAVPPDERPAEKSKGHGPAARGAWTSMATRAITNVPLPTSTFVVAWLELELKLSLVERRSSMLSRGSISYKIKFPSMLWRLRLK